TGLETIDHRMGYRGALGNMPADRFAVLRPLIETRLGEVGRRPREAPLVADLSTLIQPSNAEAEGTDESPKPKTDESMGQEEPPSVMPDNSLARKVPLVPLKLGTRLGGYVTVVNDKLQRASVDFVGRVGQMSFSTL